MIQKIITTSIRVILTITVLYFIYKETGPATTLFALAMAVYTELSAVSMDKILAELKKLNDKNPFK